MPGTDSAVDAQISAGSSFPHPSCKRGGGGEVSRTNLSCHHFQLVEKTVSVLQTPLDAYCLISNNET